MNSKVMTTEKKEPAIALDECLLCMKDFKKIFEILQKGSPPWLPLPKIWVFWFVVYNRDNLQD